jgi:hypothetical protein
MYNSDTILSLLQNGHSAEDIAKSFTDALNSAIQEQKAAESAKAAASQKHADMKNILEEVLLFFSTYYPELIPEVEEISNEEIAEFIDLIDEAVPDIVELVKSLKSLQSLTFPAPTAKRKITVKRTNSVDDAINTFLRTHNL